MLNAIIMWFLFEKYVFFMKNDCKSQYVGNFSYKKITENNFEKRWRKIFLYIFIINNKNIKLKKMNKEKTILVRIDEDLYNSVRKYCKDNGINLSQKLRNYLISEIEKGK